MKKQFQRQQGNETIRDLYRGCLLGGAVGDALGAPVEFLSRAEIIQKFGPKGIQEYATAFGKLGGITDDTQMTLFTAEGVMRAWTFAFDRGSCHIPSVIAQSYLRWLHTQGEKSKLQEPCLDGWLLKHQKLFHRRAPGHTCLSGLKGMQKWNDLASNDSKGCGGVMRVAPIGMYYAALAGDANLANPQLIKDSFQLGCEAAAITHGHPTGQLASGTFAAIVMQLLLGVELRQAIGKVLPLLAAHKRHKETTLAIQAAIRLAQERPNDAETLSQLGGGWIAEEALAIALYSALAATDFRSGVALAVNHSGDSDSTGSMTGQLLGAIYGVKDIPDSWLDPLELRIVIESMADDLSTVPEWRLDDEEAQEESNFYFYRYPGATFPGERREQNAESVEANRKQMNDQIQNWFKNISPISDEDIKIEKAKSIAFAKWEESFRADAEADNCQILAAHLCRLNLPGEPDLLLDGTVDFVRLTAGYSTLENQFLQNQKYDSVQAIGAPYQVTFDIHQNAYARLNLYASLQPVDLADLYNESAGYSDFWISRADGVALNADEVAAFEKVIWSDFLHDHCRSELEIWFEYEGDSGILNVTVQPADEDEDEDFDEDEMEDQKIEDPEQAVHGRRPHD